MTLIIVVLFFAGIGGIFAGLYFVQLQKTKDLRDQLQESKDTNRGLTQELQKLLFTHF